MYKYFIGSLDKCVLDIKKISCLGGGKKKNKFGMINWQSERSCFREKKKKFFIKQRLGQEKFIRYGEVGINQKLSEIKDKFYEVD